MKSTNGIKGFTLIEIIVAISILVILAGIAIPVISGQIDKAKAAPYCWLCQTKRSGLPFWVIVY